MGIFILILLNILFPLVALGVVIAFLISPRRHVLKTLFNEYLEKEIIGSSVNIGRPSCKRQFLSERQKNGNIISASNDCSFKIWDLNTQKLLEAKGIKEGDTVNIFGFEFDFVY